MDIWLWEQCWTPARASVPWRGWQWEMDLQGIGELLQPIRCLSCKHESLRSDGQHSCEIWACSVPVPLCWESKAGVPEALVSGQWNQRLPGSHTDLGSTKSKLRWWVMQEDTQRHFWSLDTLLSDMPTLNMWLHPNWKCEGILTKKQRHFCILDNHSRILVRGLPQEKMTWP